MESTTSSAIPAFAPPEPVFTLIIYAPDVKRVLFDSGPCSMPLMSFSIGDTIDRDLFGQELPEGMMLAVTRVHHGVGMRRQPRDIQSATFINHSMHHTVWIYTKATPEMP